MTNIGNKIVGPGQPVFTVAEIGINHNGDIGLVIKLIDEAIRAGCDAVKFQKRDVAVVYTAEDLAKPRSIPRENGILENAVRRGVLDQEAAARLHASAYETTTNGDLKWALELTEAEYRVIDTYCNSRDILWFASPWDEASVDFLERFDPPCFKIASASLTDRGLLEHIRSKNRPVILSTGGSTLNQVKQAVEILGGSNLILMHCVATYPAKDEDLGLEVIRTLQSEFPGTPVGYSGHEKGIFLSLAAAAMGACAIERHITLDRRLWGSDQAASIEPSEFAKLVEQLRSLESARGSGEKIVLPAEAEVMKKLRRKSTL